ncbi:MAG: endonuclease [Chthoniobacter sp.]|jgi:endonuclease-3|nr:endonuclease [Chthoniobacter sp.]
MTRQECADALVEAFAQVYPEAHCELNFSTPLELLVATILSAQCTDKRVNLVTPTLFKQYRTAREFAAAPQDVLEKQIQSTGFFRSKSKSIRAAAADIAAKHGGYVPETMEDLTALRGVGRKTANVVLGNAFGKNEGVVVDTHVARLSARLGLSRQTDPEKIERDLIKLIPRDHWTIFSHWLIWHGRRRCTARNPDCAGCEVQKLCPSAFKVGGAKPAVDAPAKLQDRRRLRDQTRALRDRTASEIKRAARSSTRKSTE